MAKTTIPAGYFAAGSIATADIADDAVTADKLAANSVVSASIVNGTIVSADIAANTIATSNIADNAVDATKIASNSILTRHIDDNQVGIDQLNVSDGSNGQVLTTNGSGTLSFSTVGGTTINSNADNRVITGSGTANTLNGESNLVYDGTNLSIGVATPNTQLHIYKANTTAHHDHIKLEMGTGWSGHQNYYKNIVWNDGTNNVGGIGMTYDGTTTNMHFHSMYNGGYKSETTNILSLLGSGKVGINASAPTQALEVVDSNNYKGIHIRGSVAPCLTFAQSSSTTPTWRVGVSGYDGAAFAIATGASVGDRLHIKSDGRVGIGTTSPVAGAALDVQSYMRAGNIYVGLDSGNRLEAGNGQIYPGTMSLIAGATNMDINQYVVVTGVGISLSAKCDSPSGDWYTNDGTVSSLSDKRVKTEITNLSDGLEIVKQLRPVTFKYNDDSEDEKGRKRMGAASDKVRYGFIAQEVEEVAPQYVETGMGYINNEEVDDFKSMSTTRMIPMLFKAIQELEARVKELEG